MPLSETSPDQVSTRRQRRKNGESDKVLSLTPKKKQTPKKGTTSGATTTRGATRLGSSGKKAKAPRAISKAKSSNQGDRVDMITDKEKQQFTALLQKMKKDKTMLSALSADIHGAEDDDSSHDEVSDADRFSPPHKKKRTHNKSTSKKTAVNKGRQSPTADNEEDEDDAGVPEFQAEEQYEEHEEDGENNERETDALRPAGVGGTDDELEVSFNDPKYDDNDEQLETPVLQLTQQSPDTNVVNNNEGDRDELPVPSNESTHQRAATIELSKGNAGFDESVTVNLVDMLKKSFFTELQSSFHKLMAEIRSERENNKQLHKHVSELTSIVTTTATAIFIKTTSAQPRMKEIQRKLCLLPAFFNDQFTLKIIPRVVIGFFVNNFVSGSPYSVVEKKGVGSFSLLFFSKQPNERKREKYSSEVGKVFSKFRYSLLTTSILAMQNNSFSTFRSDSAQDDVIDLIDGAGALESSTVSRSVSAITQPSWLKPGYITIDHCVLAAEKQENRVANEMGDEPNAGGDASTSGSVDNGSINMQESSQSSGKMKVTRGGPFSRDEVAVEAAGMVYKLITGVLYKSRVASKTQLFHDITYVFVGWGHHHAAVDQESLKLHWEKPKSTDVAYIEDLPVTKLISPNQRYADHKSDADKIDTDNVLHLETLISQHPELSLIVEHDVMVNGSKYLLRYRINLIEVVCRFLASYVTLDSAANGKDALCTDKRSLKAIVVLAIGLRRLMEKAVSDLNSCCSVLWSNNGAVTPKRGRPKRSRYSQSNEPTSEHNSGTNYEFEVIDGMSLDQLLPAPSKQKELLNNMILNLTLQEYDAKSLDGGAANRASGHAGIGHTNVGIRDAPIQADESQCVFRF